jgi:hypothetical protein
MPGFFSQHLAAVWQRNAAGLVPINMIDQRNLGDLGCFRECSRDTTFHEFGVIFFPINSPTFVPSMVGSFFRISPSLSTLPTSDTSPT